MRFALGNCARKTIGVWWIVLGGAVVLAPPVHGADKSKRITFADACVAGDRMIVAAVGDLIFHNQLLRKAFHKRRGFRQFWAPMEEVIREADLAYGNLEGPTAEGVAAGGRRVRDPGWRIDNRVYGYRLPNVSFNFHPQVVTDLKESGFDIISTANNHAMDRGPLGVDKTVGHLDRVGLAFTGSRSRDDMKRPWSRVTVVPTANGGGIRVAWLACTYSTNGIPDPEDQVLECYDQRDIVLGEIARRYAEPDVDAVILTPHWGNENSRYVAKRQRELAHQAIEAGASAVLGAHPHVLQPWEKITLGDGREGLIVYSMGNFVSNQRRAEQRTGAVVLVELTRPSGAKARVTAAGYIPTHVVIDGKAHRPVEARAKSWSLRHATRVYPAGNRVGIKNWRELPGRCRQTAAADPGEADE